MLGSSLQNRLRGRWLVGLITVIDTSSSIWFGYCQGVFAGVLVSPDFLETFPQTADSNISGIVTSCFLLGAFFGAIAAFVLGDVLGRRRSMMLGHALNVVGAILQFTSWDLGQMVTGRVINGFGIGVTSTMSPVYLSECVLPQYRGILLVIGASSNVASFCLANWISYALYDDNGPFQWRFPLAFQLIFGAIIFPVLFCVPESPRWLLLMDKDQDAMRVLCQLIGDSPHDESFDDDDGLANPNSLAVAEYQSIKSAIHLERACRAPLSDVLRSRDKGQNLRRLILSCGTQFMQQFAGINALGFYLPTLLHENIGYDLPTSRLLTAVSGTVYLCAAFASLFVIDSVGRRKLMMIGSVACGLCHLIASIVLKIGQDDASMALVTGKVAVAMFILFHVAFSPTWGGVPWVYAAEINSLGWRTRGAAAATSTNWIMGFVIVQFTKVGINSMGWAFYLMFAVICFSYLPIVYLFYPETSARTLEDMDCIFINNPSWIVCGNNELTQRSRPEVLVEAEKERIAQSGTTTPYTGASTPQTGMMTPIGEKGTAIISISPV